LRYGFPLACAVAIGGCGGEKRQPVRGTVTLDGKPLVEALVAFMPAESTGSPSFATTDSRGQYRLQQNEEKKGAARGRYTVRITTYREAEPHSDSLVKASAERVPARYNVHSRLVVEVTPETKVLDFTLVAD
jgi:hypothetical protein